MTDSYEPIKAPFDFSSEFPNGKDDEGQEWVMPSEEVARIIQKLFGSTPVKIGGRAERSISADRIAKDDLEILNRFVATISGRADCTIVSVDGCCSCVKVTGKEKDTNICANKFITSCKPQGYCVYCCIG